MRARAVMLPIALCLAVGAGGCDKRVKRDGSDALPSTAALSSERADGDELMIATFEAMNQVVVDNQNDCEKMATAIRKFTVKNENALKAMKERDARQTEADKKAFEQKYAARIQASLQRMMPAAAKCQKSKSVEDAMRAMPG